MPKIQAYATCPLEAAQIESHAQPIEQTTISACQMYEKTTTAQSSESVAPVLTSMSGIRTSGLTIHL